MRKNEPASLELIVFDIGGTIVDHGCMAPVSAFVRAFQALEIQISIEQARGPMGLAKLDHIRELFKLSSITQQWQEQYSRDWNEDDVSATYTRFLPLQTQIAKEHTDVISGFSECWSHLRKADISIGLTTGYPRDIARPILAALNQAGFDSDADVCADEVPAGRPEPFMIQRIMEECKITNPQAVVKVGDTVPDMQAARNADAWGIGITETGSEFGLTKEALTALSPTERITRHDVAAAKLRGAGAHAIIKSLRELPLLISQDTFRH